MSAASFQQVRVLVPPGQHQVEFDTRLGAVDAATQGGILAWIQKLEAFLAQFGAKIQWNCIWPLWSMILAAAAASLANPADLAPWLAVFTAYMACAHPAPLPTP
jgi:hypothetical protein